MKQCKENLNEIATMKQLHVTAGHQLSAIINTTHLYNKSVNNGNKESAAQYKKNIVQLIKSYHVTINQIFGSSI